MLNDPGQAAFRADLTGTDNNRGIFTGDGIDLLQVVRRGDALAGSTIADLFLADVSTGVIKAANGADSINQHGQIAYRAQLADGNQVVGLWTPDLHWRTASNGAWNTASNWTLGLNPVHVHDVFIDPATNLTVTGPFSNTTVRNLQIGGGSGMAKLDLQEGVRLYANGGTVTVESTGILAGSGTIVGDVSVLGFLDPGSSTGSLTFEGNVWLDSLSKTRIELGGPGTGEFDQLVVMGDLSLDGDLIVSLVDGHGLGANRHYLIGDVSGNLSGQFNGLEQDGLVGNLGGWDLFISYSAGNGNGIALYTVPEPSSFLLLSMAVAGIYGTRRRNR